jgi:hypothetical protein
MTTDTELTNAVRKRVPAATVTLRPIPKIDVTRVEISVNFGVSFEVSDLSIATFRGDPRVLMIDRPMKRLERDALETHFAAALADRDRTREQALARAEDKVGRARRLLSDYLAEPRLGDGVAFLARLGEALR